MGDRCYTAYFTSISVCHKYDGLLYEYEMHIPYVQFCYIKLFMIVFHTL